jgi:hypothetical protein
MEVRTWVVNACGDQIPYLEQEQFVSGENSRWKQGGTVWYVTPAISAIFPSLLGVQSSAISSAGSSGISMFNNTYLAALCGTFIVARNLGWSWA